MTDIICITTSKRERDHYFIHWMQIPDTFFVRPYKQQEQWQWNQQEQQEENVNCVCLDVHPMNNGWKPPPTPSPPSRRSLGVVHFTQIQFTTDNNTPCSIGRGEELVFALPRIAVYSRY